MDGKKAKLLEGSLSLRVGSRGDVEQELMHFNDGLPKFAVAAYRCTTEVAKEHPTDRGSDEGSGPASAGLMRGVGEKPADENGEKGSPDESLRDMRVSSLELLELGE